MHFIADADKGSRAECVAAVICGAATDTAAWQGLPDADHVRPYLFAEFDAETRL